MASSTPGPDEGDSSGSGFLRNSLLMFGGAAGSQLLTFLVMPLLTRLFPPEAIGVHALVVSASGALVVIATLRLDLALVLPEDDGVAARLWWLGFYQGVATSFVVVVVALVAGDWIAASLAPEVSSSAWVWLLAPMVLAAVVTQMGTGLATRRGKFHLVVASNLTIAGVFALVAVLIGYADPVDTGVVVARVTAVVAGCLVFLALVAACSRPGASWRPRDLDPRRLWREQRQFLVFNTPYSLVGGLTRDLPLYVFAIGGGAALTASYALARTITQAPTSLVSAALSSVFYREAALHLGTPRLKTLALTLSRWGLVLTMPGFAFVAVWGDELFALVFGQTWRTAGDFARLLAVPLWLALQNGWPQRLYEATGRQRISFTIQMCFDALHAVVVIGVYAGTGSAMLAVAAYAVTYSAFHITYLAVVFGLAGFGRRELWRVGSAAALGFAVVAALLGGARWWSPLGAVGDFVLAATAVVGLTAGLALLLRRRGAPTP